MGWWRAGPNDWATDLASVRAVDTIDALFEESLRGKSKDYVVTKLKEHLPTPQLLRQRVLKFHGVGKVTAADVVRYVFGDQ